MKIYPKMKNRVPMLARLATIAMLCFCKSSQAAEVTGRISMGLRDPLQCGFSYSGDEKVQGYPVVAVDGNSFGSLYDGQRTANCGQKVKINGVIHIIADRIWQNDGEGGSVYTDKYNADRKSNGVAPGYTQYDTAQYTYWARGGNGNFDVIWLSPP